MVQLGFSLIIEETDAEPVCSGSGHCETLPRVLCAAGSTLRQRVLLQCCRLPHYARNSETVANWRRMWWRMWWRMGSL
jgi:hypothetical protein